MDWCYRSQHHPLSLPRPVASVPGSTRTSGDRVGDLPGILDRDEDAQEAETIGEAEGPKCSDPFNTRPEGVRTPVLVVASAANATGSPRANPAAARWSVYRRAGALRRRGAPSGSRVPRGLRLHALPSPTPALSPSCASKGRGQGQDRGGQAGGGVARALCGGCLHTCN